LPCRGGQEIFPSHDVRDPKGAVVHNHGQLVGPQAIAATDHKVPGVPLQRTDLKAPEAVPKGDLICAQRGRAKAKRVGAGGRISAVSAGPGVGAALGAKDLSRAVTLINETRLLQRGQGGFIGGRALALIHHGTIPGESVGLQAPEDEGVGSRHFPRWV